MPGPTPLPRRPWTGAEERRLARLWNSGLSAAAATAIHTPARTLWSIRSKLADLQRRGVCPARRARAWTAADDELLRARYRRTDRPADLAAELDRTPTAIHKRAFDLGITIPSREGKT